MKTIGKEFLKGIFPESRGRDVSGSLSRPVEAMGRLRNSVRAMLGKGSVPGIEVQSLVNRVSGVTLRAYVAKAILILKRG